MSARRDLRFDSWDDVVSDLQSLANGYEQHGSWSLGQAARHLNDWLHFPMDGFPQPALPIRLVMSLVRVTVGKSMLNKILASNKMNDRGPTMPQTVYQPTDQAGEVAAVHELLETIERFRQFQGQIHASPIFGTMDKATAERLQLVHFAHHLSWLSPKQT